MTSDPDARRPWLPRYKWNYGMMIIGYNKGGMLKKEGWNSEDFDDLSALGDLGWEAFSVTRLNDTQSLVFMKFPVPWDVGEADADQEFMQNMAQVGERVLSK